jgi:acyl-CoA synthetase (AMP-forming)/AMP-acid ligase II
VTTFNLADFRGVATLFRTARRSRRRAASATLSSTARDAPLNALASRGIGRGDNVGVQLVNGSEYLEVMLAAYKLRAVPINVNYRYVEGELLHLFEDADLAALVLHRAFAPRVAAVAPRSPRLGVFLAVDDAREPSRAAGCGGGLRAALRRLACASRPLLDDLLHRLHWRDYGRPRA